MNELAQNGIMLRLEAVKGRIVDEMLRESIRLPVRKGMKKISNPLDDIQPLRSQP
ncbi:hypothetical protein D3C72_2458770 [compost metagenome]